MSVSLTLFIPSLTSPLSAWKRDFGFSPESTVFSNWLKHTHIKTTSSVGFERSLFSSLGFPDHEELPIARYRVINEVFHENITGKQLSESQQTLLCADPVHCEAGMKDVTLTQSVRDLGKAETDELITLLNQHFGEDGLHFFAANREQWYLQLPEKETLKTTVLADVQGRNIFPSIPSSTDRNWLALQNEVQMLLHSANLNQTREISGLPSVNSLWFWGGGDVFTANRRFDHVFARENSTEAGLFANANDTRLSGLSLESLEKYIANNAHSHVAIVFDQLIHPAQATDLDSWQDELNRLEKDYIKTLWLLWQGQKKGQLEISIDTCHGKILTPLKSPRWRFWKRSPVNLLDFA